MRNIVSVFALILSLAGLLAAQSSKPNIIFIMADDMGYADAGAYGGKLIQTPNIDRLAREGLRFTQVYSGHPVCAPSRNVLMTGMHTGHTVVRGNFGAIGVVGIAGGKYRVPIRDEDITVAEVLKQAGYATGITGKWGLGEPKTDGIPNKQGFDEWFGYLNQRRAHTYYPTFIWLNEAMFDLPGNQDGERGQYTTDLFTGFAMNFIRRHAAGTFFLYVPYTTPHAAFEVPSLGDYENKPWSPEQRAYAAMITRMDNHIGRILDLLGELGIANNTVVFFTSDNGAQNRYEGLFDSAGPFREQKGSVYDGGIRVPMIVRWPGRTPAGRTNDSTVWYFADFLPTAAAIAGAAAPPNLDGVSVLPALLGEDQRLSDRFLYWECPEQRFKRSARQGDWKAVYPGGGAPMELYNLAGDVGETRNLAANHPDVVRRFEEYFRSCRTESKEFPVKERP